MKKTIYTQEYHHLIEVLIVARKKRHLSQEDLSKLLNRPQSFVSKYEKGHRRLDLIEYIYIARLLDVPISDLLSAITYLFERVSNDSD